MKKYSLQLIALFALVIIGVIALAGGRFAAHAAGSGGTLSGWAWSSNIGWLSFNSADTGAGGGPYSVSVDGSGNFSGYAWSPNIGWVSFNSADTAGCASPSVQANVSMTSGAVTGWAKALAADNNGWNGCIQLSDNQYFTSPSGSGVSMNTTSGVFNGYAWGGTNVGWLQFNAGTGVPPVPPVTLCPPGTTCPNNTPGLTLQVNNPGSGWGSSAILTSDSSGNASAQVKWISNQLTGITVTTASSDWPEGSGADISNSGTAFNSSGSESIPFTNTGTSAIQKSLILTYTIGRVQTKVEVDITIEPYNLGSQACSQPTHTLLCSYSNTAHGPATTPRANAGQCLSTSATPISCEYYCDTAGGYALKNGTCAKSSIQEI